MNKQKGNEAMKNFYDEEGTQKNLEEHQEQKVTKEEFAKMGYQQRVKLFNENPDLYNELSGNK